MNTGDNVSYLVAFIAGILTFLSPCLFPMIPAFIAYITGVSFADLKDTGRRAEAIRKTLVHSLLFIAGFSIIFVALGLTATFIGKALFRYQQAMRIVGGAFIVLFGLYLTGLLKLDLLGKERRLNLKVKAATYLGSFLMGVIFAAAWTPCAGPILGSILVLAGTKTSVIQGAKLLAIYSLGIGLPFLITGLAVNYFLEFFNKFKKLVSAINIAGGIFLIIIGILVATNYLAVISDKLLGAFTK